MLGGKGMMPPIRLVADTVIEERPEGEFVSLHVK